MCYNNIMKGGIFVIAKVVVNVPSSNTDQFYDYILPDEFVNFAKVGSRVKVPYGPANREIMGFIMELIDNSSYRGDLKEITEVVDYEPVINDELIDVAKFIKEDAVCPLIRILNLMIPDALKIKTKKYLAMLNYKEIDARLIDIFSKKEMIEYTPELKKFDSIIAKEVQKGNLKVTYEAKQIVKDKMITKYILNKNYTYQNFKDLKRESQKEFLESLYNEIPLTKEELIEKYDVSLYTIISLAKKGYLDKNGKFHEGSLPASVRANYVAKNIGFNTVYPMLNSPLYKGTPDLITNAIKTKGKEIRYPDKMYDASFGGYYDGEKFAKYKNKWKKRSAVNKLSLKNQLLNKAGLSIQNERKIKKKKDNCNYIEENLFVK